MSVRLADVIAVLDAAYPPGLAQGWDSVGLVCGDPGDPVDAVTVAVDATAEVVASVASGPAAGPPSAAAARVDTVAASTPKGAPIHHLIRRSAALFTAQYQTPTSASPGVSDALAEVLGLTVEGVLEPGRRRSAGRQVGDLRAPEAPRAVRERVFEAGPATSVTHSQCSWSITGIGRSGRTTAPHRRSERSGRSEQVPEDRVEVVAPARLRGPVLAAMRAAHPIEEPAFDAVPGPAARQGRSQPHRQPAAATALRGLRSVREFRPAADHLGHPRGR